LYHQFKTIKKKIMAKTKWLLDPMHSELQFKIKHLMISNVSGSLKDFNAEVETEEEDFSTAAINLTAQMDSISTNNEQRDAHLRNSDFFEVEKYPELKFKSTKVEKVDSDTFILQGELTMKGVTKQVKLNVEFNGVVKDPWGNERAAFAVTGKINRTDWGVNFNSVLETGGVMLSEEVKINSEIQLLKQAVSVRA
jgi:polyisoprenoid-binding protein YceI